MLPVPRAGRLRAIRGRRAALAVPHIAELDLSVHEGAELEPLPEGPRYLGFLFARAPLPQTVENALRTARDHLEFDIH